MKRLDVMLAGCPKGNGVPGQQILQVRIGESTLGVFLAGQPLPAPIGQKVDAFAGMLPKNSESRSAEAADIAKYLVSRFCDGNCQKMTASEIGTAVMADFAAKGVDAELAADINAKLKLLAHQILACNCYMLKEMHGARVAFKESAEFDPAQEDEAKSPLGFRELSFEGADIAACRPITDRTVYDMRTIIQIMAVVSTAYKVKSGHDLAGPATILEMTFNAARIRSEKRAMAMEAAPT